MLRSGWFVVVAGCVASCWSSDDLIDGAFTSVQWSHLQRELAQPPIDGCTLAGLDPSRCPPAVQLASLLFEDPALSSTGTVSCVTCHDPTHGFVDPRTPNNVSLGTMKYTKRNASTLVDSAYKQLLAPGRDVYTWSGQHYQRAGDVLDLAVVKPMTSSHAHVAELVRGNAMYAALYASAFAGTASDDETMFHNLETAFDAMFAQPPYVVPSSPFDLWLAGMPSPMSDSAKRGFAVFVGKGTCIECHNGPLLSDLEFHDTGVPQQGEHVPATDLGRADTTMDPADAGKFLTPSLRDVALTAPYMHDGALATLGDVIEFYRGGGVATGYSGTRDPRIVALDLSDDDARDLAAFLASLTHCDAMTCPGAVAPPAQPPPPPPPPPDAATIDAPAPDALMPDAAACAPTMMSCGGLCIDTTVDPLNCGACGNQCKNPTPNCAMGTCVH